MRRGIPIAVTLLFLVLAILPATGGEVTEKWKDGRSGFTVVSELTTGGQMSTQFTIPKYSDVHSASVKIRGEPVILDEGQEYQSIHWPTDASMDLFSDGTPDWKFPGKMGLQTSFTCDTTEAELSWESPGTTKSVEFQVPRSTIQAASVAICNTQTSKFSYQMKVGDAPVWSKDSLSFSLSDYSPVRETLSCIAVGDINNDGNNEMVAGSAGGKIYIARTVGGKFMNATVVDCYVEGSQKDILSITLGLLDDQAGLDIVASCADGNIYFLLNQGGTGLYGGAAKIETGAGGRMASVALGDLNGDGTTDIVSGALNGRFYVFLNTGGAQFDTTPGSAFFKPIPAGSGQMNDVEIVDVNQDTYPDIVGANANKQFYIAYNTGSGASFDNPFPVVTGAARDMNSVACEDIDGDTDPDLVGASNDGKVYICLNLGNAQQGNIGEFDTIQGHVLKVTCESGTDSLRTAVVKDINDDSAPDIIALGTSNNGQVYLQLNDGFGNFRPENLIKSFSAGQLARDLQVDLMNKDTSLDIVVANGTRMDVWLNNQGKFGETVSGAAFTTAIQNYVNNASAVNDPYGNPMVTVPLSIYNRYTGKLRLTNLMLNYSFTAVVDFKDKLWNYVNESSTSSGTDPINVPVTFRMESAGKLNVSLLRVESVMGLVAIIDSPIENGTCWAKSPIILSGHSNYDIDGSLYNYSWYDNETSAFLGYGSSGKAFTPIGLYTYTIRLKVRDDLNGREASTLVKFRVIQKPMPYLTIPRVNVSNREPAPGDTVTFTIFVRNTGTANASDVGVQIFLDNEKGHPIASGVIDRIDMQGTAILKLRWEASGPGGHKYLVKIVQSDNIQADPKSYEVAMNVNQASTVPFATAATAGIFFLGIGIVGYFLAGTEVGIYGVYLLFTVLYSKIKKEEVLDSHTRGEILGYVRANPGCHYNLIKQDLNLKNGTLTHHLDTLERNQYIRSARDGVLKRFFPGDQKIPTGRKYLNTTQESMLKYIKENPGASMGQLIKALYLEPHIVRYHIKILKDANLIRIEQDGKRYQLYAS